jgi:hypothetical protein
VKHSGTRKKVVRRVLFATAVHPAGEVVPGHFAIIIASRVFQKNHVQATRKALFSLQRTWLARGGGGGGELTHQGLSFAPMILLVSVSAGDMSTGVETDPQRPTQ